MQRQILESTTALRADDIRAPAVLGKAVRQAGGKRECRIAPEIVDW